MCLNPTRAQQDVIVDKRDNSYLRFGTPKINPEGNLLLPCGKCNQCLSLRAIHWATRARHEIAQHNENCFLTLTYDDQHLPSHICLKSPFQKFMKRLRRHSNQPLKYMVSHEYGSKFFRPHHHAIIFGFNPHSQRFLKNAPSGEKLFTSPQIDNLWENGFHSIGSANERSAYYIASYALKGAKHDITLPSGEIFTAKDSFNCSRGIGLEFLINNAEQIINSNQPVPRYYLKKLLDINPQLHQHYETEIMSKIKSYSSQEILAKFIISEQKKFISDGEFRAPETTSEIEYMRTHYKQVRDNHAQLKKEKSNV